MSKVGGELNTSVAVTIIVISYNHEAFIDDCLRSCVEQADDVPDLQIVVADDGSADQTQEIVQRWATNFPTLVVPVLSKQNGGIAANFNRGLAVAKGPLVAWLGGDDIMLPGKIKLQKACMDRHPEVAGCYHDAEVFAWPSGNTLGLFSELYAGKAAQAKYMDAKRMLDPRYQMLPSTVMVRRRCVPNSFDTRLRFHNDYLFDFETIVRGGPFIRLEGVFVRYRKHQGSVGLSPVTKATMLEENMMVAGILEARFPEFSGAINRRAIYYLSLEAIKSYRDRNPGRARAICAAVYARGAWLRALGLFLFGGPLSRLADPRYRRLAVKIRSLLA